MRPPQERAVTAAHKLDAVPHETDGGFADRMPDPRSGIDLVTWKQGLADGAIGRVLRASVDRPEHLAQALATLRRQPVVWRDGVAPQARPQTMERMQSIRRVVGQQNEGGDWHGRRHVRQHDVDRPVREVDSCVSVACVHWRRQRAVSPGCSRGRDGRRDEDNFERIGSRGPGDRRRKGGVGRIYREMTTPKDQKTTGPVQG